MVELILKLLDQLNSSVFTLLAILIIAFYSVYKLGGIVNTFDLFKEKNKELDDDVASIKDSLAEIKATTNLLYQAHLKTVQTNSPLSISPVGQVMSNDLALDAKVNAHWEEIKRALETRNPSNPYDVQTISMDLARHCFDKVFSQSEQDQIKLYAYQKGNNLLEIVPIIGIIMRDKFLKEKGMATEEIDKHAPTA